MDILTNSEDRSIDPVLCIRGVSFVFGAFDAVHFACLGRVLPIVHPSQYHGDRLAAQVFHETQ